MIRRKYIVFIIIFALMILGIGDIGYAANTGCSFLDNKIVTDNNDVKIHATDTEEFIITSRISWSGCGSYPISYCRFNISVDVPQNYIIYENTVTCTIDDGAFFNKKYFEYISGNISKIMCEYITRSNSKTTFADTLFNTTAKTPTEDTNDMWTTIYGLGSECTKLYTSDPLTTILAPNLQIQPILKYPSDSYDSDYAYLNTNFTLSITAKNYHSPWQHTGKAFGVYSNLTYNVGAFTPVNCNPENIIHGDIESGNENISACMFSANNLGYGYNFYDYLSDWTGYYNYEQSKILNVVNLTLNSGIDNMYYSENPTQIYVIVIDNASVIETVNATWTYIKINDSYELELTSGNCTDMAFDHKESEGLTEKYYYRCDIVPNSSGLYNVTFNVLDEYGTYNISAANTTDFDIDFGVANITGVGYNYKDPIALILKNQTFNLTADLSIIYGDVWGVNVSLESSNPEIINISAIANQTQILGNLKNGYQTLITWNDIYADNSGLVKLTVKTTVLNGTGVEYYKYPQIVDILVDVKNNTLNITDIHEGQIKFAGNFSKTKSLNLTIQNEFDQFDNWQLEDFYMVDANECYKLEGESHNVALPSYGASASNGGGFVTYDPNATIDDNPASNWYGITTITGATELNITFNETQTLQGIQLLWNDNNGNANVSAYYYYCRSEMKFFKDESCSLVKEEIITNYNPPNTTNTSIFEKVYAGVTKIQIIQSANNSQLNIYSLEAYTTPVTDYEPPCIIFNYTYNINRSGTHQITPEIQLTKSSTIRTNANNFLVNFGRPKLFFVKPTWLLNSINQYPVQIQAINGDIYNITINLTIENETIINYTATENITKNITVIYDNDEMYDIKWNLNATSIGTTPINITLNSTTLDDMYILNTSNITVILEDNVPPIINSYWLNHNKTNATNLYTSISVYVNVSDKETSVKNITINITRPNMEWFEQVKTTISGELQTIEINSSKLNETGKYTLNISAYDLGSNVDYGNTTITFNVTDIYHLKPKQNHSIFMRGETVTINLLDINNITVNNANWTLNLTKSGQNEKMERNGITYLGDYSYLITTNDTVGTYLINILNATKNGNYVNNTIIKFNVSKTLNVVLNTTIDSVYPADSFLPRIRAWLYNVRNEPKNLNNLWLYYNNLNYSVDYKNPVGPYELSDDLKSSATSGASLPLIINITDSSNNTGEIITYINAAVANPPPGGVGGGSGGSSGASSSSGGGLNFGSIPTPQNKTPAYNFDYNIENTERNFRKGYPDTIIATITNTGDMPLIIYTATSPSPINITLDNNFTLDVGADKSFKITLHANLSINPGIYYADIMLYNEKLNLEKTRTLKMNIVENDVILDFNKIKNDAVLFEQELNSFEKLNIDISNIKKQSEKISQYLMDAELSIKNNQLENLQFSVDKARSELFDAKLKTTSLKTTQFIIENKWSILGYGTALILSLYILLYLLIPYSKISNRIRKLTRMEKIIIDTRKATEKKYFMRQLNEATFNKIMAEEEDKLLKLRSEIAKLTQELNLLKHLKLKEIRHLEDDEKKKKDIVKKERMLKETSKRKMSDIILDRDMKKKKTFLEYFGFKKKKKEFVFDNFSKKTKSDKINKEKISFFLRPFERKKLTDNLENKTIDNSEIKEKNPIKIIDEHDSTADFISDTKKNKDAIFELRDKENFINNNEIRINNELSYEPNKEKTLYSTNNKEDIKEEINNIKKILRSINKDN